MTNNNISAVIVIYNPADTVLRNVEMISGSVGRVFVVDNSDVQKNEFINSVSSLPNVRYISLHGNAGVAAALNIGAKSAIEEGFRYLLTMDQDSCPEQNMIDNMVQIIDSDSSFGILSPQYELENGIPLHPDSSVIEIETTMTSGNILNLAAFSACGPFCEKLFIDYVDHEYCLRLRRHGYSIKCVQNAILRHSWGALKKKSLLGFELFTSNYASFRYYYLIRNSFYVIYRYAWEYPGFCFRHFMLVMKMCVKAMVLEPGRLKRGNLILKGFGDFVFGNYGKLKQ